jgi:hypothetical protein
LDRFTLDEVSAKIWWPLAMVALVALVLTVPAANHAADRARRESAARAIVLSTDQIEPLTTNGTAVADISAALSRIQAANPGYDAIRLWSGDERLLIASSLQPDPLRLGALNEDDIAGALSSGSRLVVTDRLPTGDPGPTTVHAYTKIDGPSGAPEVTEFEVSDAALLAQVHHDWNGYRIVAAAAFLLLFGLALLSMREPVADIGVGVPFYPATLPPNLAIVDAERAVVIEHQDDHVRQRVDSLQQRLDESERLRLKAEARLQQALTTLGTGGRNVPGLPPEPPSSTALPTRATPGPSAKPALAEPAASKPAASPPAAATPPAVTPAVAPAAAAAPAVASTSSNHAPKKRTSKRSTAKPAAERAPTPRRSRADEPAESPTPTPKPRSDPVTVVADDVAVTSKPPPPSGRDPEPRPEVVVVPTPAPAPVAAKSVAGPDDATDVLHRLVPEAESPAPLDDPRDLRARLARTAALKKPGSRERKEEREALQDGSSEQ